MAGYSGTPLVKKLGIKENFNVAFVNAPVGFKQQLDLPGGVRFDSRAQTPLDLVLLFAKDENKLRIQFEQYSKRLTPSGMLWVAWPKKGSGVATNLTFNNVQAIGLGAGLVDVKICAIDDVWSGLKFVFRLKDRDRLKSRS